jgi:CRISPR/Cas system-associated protein Cas10 (large subunit of type III CRISPR-Cas system)
MEEALKDIPAADVRPVVRGKWKRDDTEINGQKFPIGYRCSVCGTKFLIIDDPRFNFCAACGADMKGENK